MLSLLLNEKMIKALPFLEYVDHYLSYISYSHNRFKTNAAKREEVAKVFFELFVNSDLPEEKGRDLVKLTITHILEWCLGSEEARKDQSKFILLVFRLYDFMVILDIGTASEYFDYIDRIVEHPLLPEEHRILFRLRVVQSTIWDFSRITPKS